MTINHSDHLPRLFLGTLPRSIQTLAARAALHVTESSPGLPWGAISIESVDLASETSIVLPQTAGPAPTVVVDLAWVRAGDSGQPVSPIPRVLLDAETLEYARLDEPVSPMRSARLPVGWPASLSGQHSWGDMLLYEIFAGLSDAMQGVAWFTTPANNRSSALDKALARVRNAAERTVLERAVVSSLDDPGIVVRATLAVEEAIAARSASTFLNPGRRRGRTVAATPTREERGVVLAVSPLVGNDHLAVLRDAETLRLVAGWNRQHDGVATGAVTGGPTGLDFATHLDSSAPLIVSGDQPDTVTYGYLQMARTLGSDAETPGAHTHWLGVDARRLSGVDIARMAAHGTNSLGYFVHEWMSDVEVAMLAGNEWPAFADAWAQKFDGTPLVIDRLGAQMGSHEAGALSSQARRLLASGADEPLLVTIAGELATTREHPGEALYRTVMQEPLHVTDSHTHQDLPNWLAWVLVGPNKALGTFPLSELRTLYPNTSPEDLVDIAERAGNKVVFVADSFSVGGLAVAYDEATLSALIDRHRELLESIGWPTDPEGLARQSATIVDGRARPILDVAFADPSLHRTQQYRCLRAQVGAYIDEHGPAWVDCYPGPRRARRREAGVPENLHEIPEPERPFPPGSVITIGAGVERPATCAELPVGQGVRIADDLLTVNKPWREQLSTTRESMNGLANKKHTNIVEAIAAMQMRGLAVVDMIIESNDGRPRIQLSVATNGSDYYTNGLREANEFLRRFLDQNRLPMFMSDSLIDPSEHEPTTAAWVGKRPMLIGPRPPTAYQRLSELARTAVDEALRGLRDFAIVESTQGPAPSMTPEQKARVDAYAAGARRRLDGLPEEVDASPAESLDANRSSDLEPDTTDTQGEPLRPTKRPIPGTETGLARGATPDTPRPSRASGPPPGGLERPSPFPRTDPPRTDPPHTGRPHTGHSGR